MHLPPAEVYPRVCGGTSRNSRTSASKSGLSPRVRGNLEGRLGLGRRHRAIPACAGEPIRCGMRCRWTRVYPRVCGGTLDQKRSAMDRGGLSPRVRGNQCLDLLECVGRGSIPACAGEPSTRAWGPTVPRVYPRVCGGTLLPLPLVISCSGLSPRVRGNPGRLAGWPGMPGSIPACAGEPSTGE